MCFRVMVSVAFMATRMACGGVDAALKERSCEGVTVGPRNQRRHTQGISQIPRRQPDRTFGVARASPPRLSTASWKRSCSSGVHLTRSFLAGG